jgi:hypothetical protein
MLLPCVVTRVSPSCSSEDKGHVYEAYVRDTQTAKTEYSNTVAKGKTAAHVALT